jgi:hypothetical protein
VTKKYYNRTNICDNCRIGFGKANGNPKREYNKDNNWTGRWLCHKCWISDYRLKNGITRSSRRVGCLDPDSNLAKGDLFQELTCRWRSIVSTIPVEDLNKKLDNYKSPIDHTRDSELGIIQTKGRYFDRFVGTYGGWQCGTVNEKEKEFDNLIFYCVSKD